MPVNIRLASIEDVTKLQALISESVRGLSEHYYDARQIESALRYIFGVDSQLISDRSYLVAEIDGQIVGCGGWSKRKTLFGGDQSKTDSVDQLLDPTKEAARIRAFYVHPGWSRKGIGSAILKACEEAARNAGFSKTELLATLPGQPFYAAKGYTARERMDIETPDGELLPAFRMEKRLH